LSRLEKRVRFERLLDVVVDSILRLVHIADAEQLFDLAATPSSVSADAAVLFVDRVIAGGVFSPGSLPSITSPRCRLG
jgi:hypothetical protein